MNLKNKKILVTGGAGFIGRYLVNALLKKGSSVIVVDDFSKNTGRLSLKKVKLIKVKLPNSEFSKILKREKPEAIFHLTGTSYVPLSVQYPLKDLRSNTEITLSILEAIRTVEPNTHMVYFSSAAVYGNPKKIPINEDDPVNPISPYGISKLAAERYAFVYSHIHNMKTASLRPFSVYGPYQRKQVVFDLIDKLHKNPNELFVHGTGSEVRDFVYVEDVTQACITVLERGKLEGEVYNVASGKPISIKNLSHKIASIMNLNPKIIFSGKVRSGDPVHWKANITKIQKLGYRPSVNLEEGIRKTIFWYYDETKNAI